jgi:hypothetical protein
MKTGKEDAEDERSHNYWQKLLLWVAWLMILLLVGWACDNQTNGTSDGNEPAGDNQYTGVNQYVGERSQPNETSGGVVATDQSLEALSRLTASSDPQVADEPPTLYDTQKTSLAEWITRVAQDVDAFWAQRFEGYNAVRRAAGTPSPFTYESPAFMYSPDLLIVRVRMSR